MATKDERFSQLRRWLIRHGAISLWATTAGPLNIAAHRLRGGASVVVVHSSSGWDLYVPASTENKIDATLAAAEKALGL